MESSQLYAQAVNLHKAGNVPEAENLYKQIIAKTPTHADSYNMLSIIYGQRRDFNAAKESVNKALELQPNNLAYNFGKAFILTNMLDYAGAEESYKKVVALNKNFPDAYLQLGIIQRDMGKISEAINNFKICLAIAPNSMPAIANLGNTIFDTGDVTEALKYYKKGAEMQPNNADVASNFILSLHYDELSTRDELFAMAKKWAEKFMPESLAKKTHPNTKEPERKLRIGYVSADFKAHPVGFYLEGVFENHDKNNFEIYCYANQMHSDKITQKIAKAADKWFVISEMPDEHVIKLIENDKIDILIDMGGFSANNRLSVFARKPAPVQMTWIGYFDTTGMKAMDYIVSDKFLIPEGQEKYYVEKPLRLPNCYVTMRPPQFDITVGELPAKTNGYITFASFNNSRKLNKAVVELWAEILNKVPNSKLLLKSKAFVDENLRGKFLEFFVSRDIAKERLTFSGHTFIEQMFAEYDNVDIALDTFPFTGNTTSSHALWMGVPVITLAGDNYVARMSSTILNAVGHPEFVAKDKKQYVEKAVSLANNVELLAKIRKSLRQDFETSKLSDAKTFTKELEAEFRKAWKEWCSK